MSVSSNGHDADSPAPDGQDHVFGFDTLAVHAGQRPDPTTGARAMPIYQTTSYVFEDTDHAAELFALQRFGNIYTRIMNPTNGRLRRADRRAGRRRRRAGGRLRTGRAIHRAGHRCSALATRSSPRARSMAARYTQFDITLRQWGIDVVFVDPDDPENFRRAITPKTRVLYGETIGNPRIDVLDIEAVAEIAHEARRSAHDRQHLRHALPLPADRATAPISWSTPRPSSSAVTAPRSAA